MPRPQDSRIEDVTIVDSKDDFTRLCERLSSVDRFAFDAEFVAEHGYGAEACLIQIAMEDAVVLIDPLAGVDIMPFWQLISDANIEKVVHAGFEDLAISFNETGKVPRNVFDLQIAAGLVALGYPLSLMRLARSVVGARLRKSQTLSDWRQRPLTKEQVRYAVDDVAHLLAIHDEIRKRLDKRGRAGWVREEFKRFYDEETYRQAPTELFRRVKGSGSLDRKGLAVLRELAVERENLARQLNRPPRAVLKDHLMIAVARLAITEREKLRSLRGVSLRPAALDALTSAVVRALEQPREQWPEVVDVDEDTFAESAMCKLISAVLTDLCQAEGIAPQLLATAKDVRARVLAHTRGGTPLGIGSLQRGWRFDFAGALVEDILCGRRTVRIDPNQGRRTLSIE